MDREGILVEIQDSLVNLDSDEIIADKIKKALETGISAYEILTDGLSKGMDIIGKKFENQDIFLTELIVSGESMKNAVKILEPHLGGESESSCGTIVIGTVEGDIHDIGKNIFCNLARASGFKVVDLGTDVSAEKFIDATEENNAQIVGLSALLSTTMTSVKDITQKFTDRGLREKIKIIAGGAPFTEDRKDEYEVDAAVNDALKGLEKCKQFILKNKS